LSANSADYWPQGRVAQAHVENTEQITAKTPNKVCFHNNKSINTIPDNKRQQTTTVDYKRLINGFFLTIVVILQHEKVLLSMSKNKSPQNEPSMSKITIFVHLINESREANFES
jgi:hypothetical protein